jgi:tripartite-type tricarboxylate transporter receptor subunit TctC
MIPNQLRRKTVLATAVVAACAVGAFAAPGAHAQAWPDKPVKIVVPFSAGGTTDVVARMLGARLGEMWNQSVVIENRAGAGGNIGADVVAKSAPDGYTLLMTSGSIVTVNPHIYAKMPFDARKDLVPITNVAQGPMLLSVSADLPVKNVAELIALAKKKPGALNFGSAGVGTQVHMAGENFAYTAGIDILHVPYRGESAALADVAGGQIQLIAANLTASLPFVKQGKIRALGVTSLVRSPTLPDVPTVSESGLKGFENLGWFGLMAPAGTPKPVLDKVYADTAKALSETAVKARLFVVGMTAVGNSPAEFSAAIAREYDTWGKVVAQRNLKPR